MPNINYRRGRAKEYKIFHDLEKEGYLVFRSAGSHGVADVIAMKPEKCGRADHFAVRFIQVKSSINRKKLKAEVTTADTRIGLINVEFWKFPVRSRAVKKPLQKKGGKHDRRSTTKIRNRK